jgi:hypothetical protein
VFAGDLRVRPEELALLLGDLGAIAGPILLVTDASTEEGAAPFGRRLAEMIDQPVLVVHGPVARP